MPPPRPPHLAEWLLECLLPPEHEAVVGDLAEEFVDHAWAYGTRRAALLYWSELFRTVPPFFVNSLIWQSVMLKNYLVVALRNVRKHKGFSSINILGLAVSMSVCLLIIALVKEQRSFDRFHEKADRIYRVTSEVEQPFGRFRMATSPGPLAPALMAEYPGVEQAVRMTRMGGNATYEDQTFQMSGLYAEPTFFNLFDFDLALGDERTALNEPFSLVLTPETAEKFFGTENPMGKVIHRSGVGDFIVTGVLAKTTHRTHLRFEALASFMTLETLDSGASVEDWNVASSHYNYLLLSEDTSPAQVAAWSNDLVQRHFNKPDGAPPVLRLQALTNINLGDELGNQVGPIMPATSAYFLSFFALVLMLIAVFNYISLTVARSLKRAREIGVRKVMGAGRGQIMRQFVSEAVIVAVLSMVLACGLLVWLLPAFNSLQGFQEDLDFRSLSLGILLDGSLYVFFLLFAVGIGIVAGLYPAFRMASYVPTRVLKGMTAVQGFSGLVLRKMLIVFQFSLAIVGVVTTIVVYQQLAFLLGADYGFHHEQLVTVPLQDVSYETLSDEWSQLPGVATIAATSSTPMVGSKTWTDIQAPGMDEPVLIMNYAINAAFLDQFHLVVEAGRAFTETEAPEDAREPIWLTRATLATLGWATPEEAVGQVVSFDTHPEPREAVVAGIVSDLYARRYEDGAVPLVFRYLPDRYRYAVVRIQPGTLRETLSGMEAAWKTVAPTVAFSYAFFDDELAQQYLFMQDLIKFFGLLAGFVIFIACLGLLGMAAYTTEVRTREVGIRKVLGASVRGVVLLLSRDFLVLLGIAIVLATPLAYFLNRAILQSQANHIDLSLWVFVGGIVPIAVLALLTIGSQTLRAASSNPVDTLRQE